MKKFTFILITLMVISCSKDDTEVPTSSYSSYRVAQIKYNNGASENYFYNNFNQIIKTSDSSGVNIQEFYYDSKGRIEKVTNSSFLYSFNTYTEKYFYKGEKLSYMTFHIDSESAFVRPDSVCFAFDNLNRVSQSTNFFNEHLLETINYFYDANKKMIQSTIFTPDNSIIDTINFHWDINGNLIKKSAYVYRLYNNEYKAKYFEESFKYYDSYKNYLFNMQLPEIYMLYHNYYSGTIDANVSNNLLKEHVNVTDNSTIVYDVISNVDSLPN